MSLEYSDDNELIYQAKVAAKDIVNAKYEITKKVGDFLFLAHSEEEFYQRTTAVDPIIESTSTRRLASVSDSKAKLVKALFQEWEIKHASCAFCPKIAKEVSTKDEVAKEQAISDASEIMKKSKEDSESKEASVNKSSETNFNLPERVAAPILPTEKTTQQAGPARSGKLWNKWSILRRKKDGSGGVNQYLPFEEKDERGNPRYSANDRDIYQSKLIDEVIGRSLGRLDDPEILKQVTPGSSVWVDPYQQYGPDKKRRFGGIRGRKKEVAPEDRGNMSEASELTAMMGIVPGRRSLGNEGIFLTHHKCTGNSFRGFNGNETGTFPQCQHEHHEGDGCGLTSAVGAEEGSMQPGCGKQHLIIKAQTPHFFTTPGTPATAETAGTPGSVNVLPYMADEQPRVIRKQDRSELQRQINRARTPEQAEALSYTNPTQEQVGEVPLDRMFLLHPDDASRVAQTNDNYHQSHGNEGSHPANLDTFQIGDKTHNVGDIVSLGDADRPTGIENDLGVVVGASSHRNGLFTRFGKNHGLGANTDNDPSRISTKPGEYSLIIHRLNDPKTGQKQPAAVDPDTNQISPTTVNETTQYYPSSSVNTIESFDAKKLGKPGSGPGGRISKLYSRLKDAQTAFKAKSAPVRSEQPKTVKPSRENLNGFTLDLNDLFND